MNATRRLMLASAIAACVVGTALPLAGALFGQVDWQALPRGAAPPSVGYVLPAMLATALAAVPVARDPDFPVVRAACAGAASLLLAFVGFFVLMLAWVSAMKDAGVMPQRMADGAPVTPFATLAFAVVAAVPGWIAATLAVAWARRGVAAEVASAPLAPAGAWRA